MILITTTYKSLSLKLSQSDSKLRYEISTNPTLNFYTNLLYRKDGSNYAIEGLINIGNLKIVKYAVVKYLDCDLFCSPLNA